MIDKLLIEKNKLQDEIQLLSKKYKKEKSVYDKQSRTKSKLDKLTKIVSVLCFSSFIVGAYLFLAGKSAPIAMLGWGIIIGSLIIVFIVIFLYAIQASSVNRISTELHYKRNSTIREIREKQQLIEQIETEIKMRKAGLFPFIDSVNRKKFGTREQIREWALIDTDVRNRFSNLTPRQFEELIARLFQKMGFSVSLTSLTGDYGADIIAKKGNDKIIIEVKKYAQGNNISNKSIRQLLGAMPKFNANKAIFVTSSDFTLSAEVQAKNSPIELWNYDKLKERVLQYMVN